MSLSKGRGGRRQKNPLSQRPAARIFRKVGYAIVPVKSQVKPGWSSLNTAPNHEELKSQKPLCYCANSILRHWYLVPSSSLA